MKRHETMLHEQRVVTHIRYLTKRRQKHRKWLENLQDNRDFQLLYVSSFHQIRVLQHGALSRISWLQLLYLPMSTITVSVIPRCSRIHSVLSSPHFATSHTGFVSWVSCRESVNSLAMSSRHSTTFLISTTINLLSSPGSSIRCSRPLRISDFRKSHLS